MNLNWINNLTLEIWVGSQLVQVLSYRVPPCRDEVERWVRWEFKFVKE